MTDITSTVNDALTIVTVVGSAVLVVFGRKIADVLKGGAPLPDAPIVQAATHLLDRDTTNRLLTALETIAKCMSDLMKDQQDQHRRETNERLEAMEQLLRSQRKHAESP